MVKYTICKPGTTKTEGPYTIEELAVLMHNGMVNEDTLYYDQVRESWIAIKDNEYLMTVLFEDEKNLELRARSGKTMLPFMINKEGGKIINVSDLLAAAEGMSAETKYITSKRKSKDFTAGLMLPALALMMFLSALVLLIPYFSEVRSLIEFQSFQPLLDNPLILLGGFDLLMMLLLALALTEVFPLIRLRASLGVGFCLYYFFVTQTPGLLAAYTLGYLALFICTVCLNPFVLIPSIIVGLIAFGSLLFKVIMPLLGV